MYSSCHSSHYYVKDDNWFGCLRAICWFKLDFWDDLWSQKGHWNCGSFPHSSRICLTKLFFHRNTLSQSLQGKMPGRAVIPFSPNIATALGKDVGDVVRRHIDVSPEDHINRIRVQRVLNMWEPSATNPEQSSIHTWTLVSDTVFLWVNTC